MNEYLFTGSWDENAFLKIIGKAMEIYEVGTAKDADSALFVQDFILANEINCRL